MNWDISFMNYMNEQGILYWNKLNELGQHEDCLNTFLECVFCGQLSLRLQCLFDLS